MEKAIHSAIITSIKGNTAQLRIRCNSACQNCMAKRLCAINEYQDRNISAILPETEQFKIGEEVNVSLDSGQGLKAVLLAYVLPLFLLLVAILAAKWKGYDDFISGISGIIILIPYYFCLSLVLERLKTNFRLTVSKKEISREHKRNG